MTPRLPARCQRKRSERPRQPGFGGTGTGYDPGNRQPGTHRRIASRAAAGAAELEQARLHLQGLVVERESHRPFLETAAAEAAGVREESRLRQQQAREASHAVSGAEQQLESARRYAMQLLTQAGQARNQTSQRGRVAGGLEQDAERLAAEIASASPSSPRWAQSAARSRCEFESVTEQLQRLEIRNGDPARRDGSAAQRRNATKLDVDRLRAEMATLTGPAQFAAVADPGA